jgi:hypothetical protein
MSCLYPPTDGGDLTISGNLKSFKGPVLNCRNGTVDTFEMNQSLMKFGTIHLQLSKKFFSTVGKKTGMSSIGNRPIFTSSELNIRNRTGHVSFPTH